MNNLELLKPYYFFQAYRSSILAVGFYRRMLSSKSTSQSRNKRLYHITYNSFRQVNTYKHNPLLSLTYLPIPIN